MNLCRTFTLLLIFCGIVSTAQEMVPNGGFESGTNGWRTWSRASNALTMRLDEHAPHSGRSALRLQHSATQDWSVEPDVRLDTRVGDLVQLECWVKLRGQGSVTLCASTWDQQGRVVAWS